MAAISIPEETFSKILTDVETLIEDVASLLDQDEIAKKKLAELKADSSLEKNEKYLNDYLKRRGVKID